LTRWPQFTCFSNFTHFIFLTAPRQCTVCGKLAELECRECFLQGMEGGSFCGECLSKVHNHPGRSRHKARRLVVPEEFRELQEHCVVPRLTMDLFAVVCIETSHYVSFLNTQQGWVFFDSMADRKGKKISSMGMLGKVRV